MGNIINSSTHVHCGEDDNNNDCSATLSLIEEDDFWLDKLRIGNSSPYTESGQVDMILPRDRPSLSRLGDALGSNRNLRSLCLDCSDELAATATATATTGADAAPPSPPTIGLSDEDRDILLDGIRRNRSVRRPVIWGRDRPFEDGAGFEILDAFAANSSNYTRFEMWRCDLGGDGAAAVVASFLGSCPSLVEVKMTSCRIDRHVLRDLLAGPGSAAGGLLPRRLERLDLDCNDLGAKGGCEVVAGALRDPACALRVLRLCRNGIDDGGAILLAGSLTSNATLEELHLGGNPGIASGAGLRAFSRLLCDVSSVSATYLSNHTLRELGMRSFPPEFRGLEGDLRLNGDTPGGRKADVGARKVLRHHPRIEVGPLLEWDLKLLPGVVDWFDKAARATGGGDDDGGDVALRKQSALFQFVRAMPTMWHASIFA